MAVDGSSGRGVRSRFRRAARYGPMRAGLVRSSRAYWRKVRRSFRRRTTAGPRCPRLLVRKRSWNVCVPAATDRVQLRRAAWRVGSRIVQRTDSEAVGSVARLSRGRRRSSSFAGDRAEALTCRDGSWSSAVIRSGRTYKQEVGGSSPPAPTSVRRCSDWCTHGGAGAHATLVGRAEAELRLVGWAAHDRTACLSYSTNSAAAAANATRG